MSGVCGSKQEVQQLTANSPTMKYKISTELEITE